MLDCLFAIQTKFPTQTQLFITLPLFTMTKRGFDFGEVGFPDLDLDWEKKDFFFFLKFINEIQRKS